jgi:hypothetical protein
MDAGCYNHICGFPNAPTSISFLRLHTDPLADRLIEACKKTEGRVEFNSDRRKGRRYGVPIMAAAVLVWCNSNRTSEESQL